MPDLTGEALTPAWQAGTASHIINPAIKYDSLK